MIITLQRSLFTLMACIIVATGCSKGKTDNSDNFNALKAHLLNANQTLTINPMAEAFAGLVEDPVEQQKMIDEAKAGYAKINIKNIYLVTGATFESNETVLGSLIHFQSALTLDEAKAQLAKDDKYKNQPMDIYMNGHFAFAVATINGKRVTPESVITAFKNFK